jgi:uncharacterized protein (TIGR00297 family)
MTATFSETRRQLVHIGMSAFALALRYLTWWQAALCAIAALLFNAFVLPGAGGRAIVRPADAMRGYPLGILLYPLAVLLLIVAFPNRLDIAGSAWGIMAFGDGAATLAGQRWGRHALPWNPAKTMEGLCAFVISGSAAGIGLAWWLAPTVAEPPGLVFIVCAPALAAVAAGLAETVPIALDDNVTVPATAGAVLWIASLTTATAWAANREAVIACVVPALAINTVAALGGWALRTVRFSGMLTGWAIGVAVYAGLGWRGWALLFAMFAAGTVASRFGADRKSLLGIAEERGGRRGGGNAWANTGLAAVAALAAVLTPYRDAATLAFVAVLTTGGSDTIASEIGKAWGGKTYLPTTLSQVRPGTPGAMSIEGTAAGFIGALALAALGVGLGLIPGALVWAAVAGALAGSLVESGLAATLEAQGIVNNDVLNFINTATGATVALVIMRML